MYFNVGGERLCLFRQAHLTVFPHCQLTTRCASRHWQTQAEEMDEEGNIYVKHVPPRLFRKLVEYIRYTAVHKQHQKVLEVSVEEEQAMRRILDYLNIREDEEVTLRVITM